MLCILWDPTVFIFREWDVIPNCAEHLITQLTKIGLKITDQLSKHVAYVITFSNKVVVLTYTVQCYITFIYHLVVMLPFKKESS